MRFQSHPPGRPGRGADRRAASRCGERGAQRRQRSPGGRPPCLDRRSPGHPATVLAAFGLGSRHSRESFTAGSVACRKFVDPLPRFFAPTPCPCEAAWKAFPGKCESPFERVKPGEGRGSEGGGGPSPPRLLVILHPLRAAPQRGSAPLRCVDDSISAERPTGLLREGQGVRRAGPASRKGG